MRLDNSSADAPAKALFDRTQTTHQGRAPRAVMDAAGSLLCGQTPDVVYADAISENGSVVWRVGMLSAGVLIWVEASRRGGLWSGDSGYDRVDDPDSLEAWARPVRRISEIRPVRFGRHDDEARRVLEWYAGYEIEFDDKRVVSTSLYSAERAEPLIEAVMKLIAGI